MAEHGGPEYATATGNDYSEHERTYDNVIKLTKVSALGAVVVLICLAIGAVAGSWWIMTLGLVLTLLTVGIGLASESGTIRPLVGVLALVLILYAVAG